MFYGALSGTAALVALGMATVILVKSRLELDRFRHVLAQGGYQVVEGEIRDFTPEGADGHPREHFRVGNSTFEYSSSDITPAFHQSAAEGGPIRPNLRVRIAAFEGSILRLEISQ